MEDLFQEIREAESLPKITKSDIISNYNRIANRIIDGEIEVLPIFIELYELIESLENIKENIKENAIKAAKEISNFEGYTLKVSSRKTWQFEHIIAYSQQKISLKSFEDYLKQATINALKTGEKEIVNHETGEIFPLAIEKNSADFLTITKTKTK